MSLSDQALALPIGYVKRTIPLDAPPVGLAYDASGTLFALEEAGFGNNATTIRQILPNGTMGPSLEVVGDDPDNLFIGGMTYDPIADRLLITDNTADGRLYAVDKNGNQQTLATGLTGVAGVAVRDTGQIFVSTAPFGAAGEVLQIDRIAGSSTTALGELGFGAGLAFDSAGDLLVQDANAVAPFLGRLQRLPVIETPGGLTFGAAVPLLAGMQSAAAAAIDGEGDIFTNGRGGLFQLAGSPLAEVLFDANGNAGQFATAIAFLPGSAPFEPFAGSSGGRLAFMADYGFTSQDSFVTIISPAASEDFNSDGFVDGGDLTIWSEHFGLAAAAPKQGDANSDGVVDGADFLAWQRALATPPATLSAGLVVPEPASLATTLWALLVGYQRLAACRRRRAARR